MGKESEILVGLYLGTSKISVVVAERDPLGSGDAQIIGIGQAQSRGIRKGTIVNLEQAVSAVSSAVEDAEDIVGFSITAATVAFSGVNAQVQMRSGMVSLGMTPRQITAEDVNRAIETALSELILPPNQCILHTIPLKYSIDGSSGIDDPLGMTGIRLEIEVQAVIVATSVVQNVVNCVERAGITVRGLVVKPLVAALGSLSAEDRSAGAISLSIGGGTTGVALFSEGRPLKLAVIPIGGEHITNDIACVCKTSFKAAEDLKKKITLDPLASHDQQISVENYGKEQVLDESTVAEIMSCRLEELLEERVLPLISDYPWVSFPSGVVLSGGVALMEGLDAFASEHLGIGVRTGAPLLAHQMQPNRNSCQYSAVAGIIVYLMEKERHPFRYIEASLGSLRGASGVTKGRTAKNGNSYVSKPKESVFNVILNSIKELF